VLDPDFAFMLQAVADDLPTNLHWVMFVPNILSLCDEEQQAKWLPLCRDWKIMGCYAQTELGHGSNVRALETTATYVKPSSSDEDDGSWIINSPTLTSTKFWPGTLGRTANTAMVIARLIDGEGIDRGIHNFLVPLRSQKDHTLLEGVTTGDIGPKIGYNNMDNGFAQFTNVKIPRRNMAMRFATVDRNGVYRKKTVTDATSKIAYITMMQVRALIINEAGKNLAMACTIVIRYSAVRRQGYKEEGGSVSSRGKKKEELQVLDYKQQQHRLFPLLASSYCFFFTGKLIMERLWALEKRLQQDKHVYKQEVSDIHSSTSSLKSFTTIVAADGIEECRKACGGHGFLQASGLPELFTTYLQNPTVEGDNHMLPQQVIKVLLKLVQAVQTEEDLTPYTQCDCWALVPSLKAILLKDDGSTSTKSSVVSTPEDLMHVPTLIDLFRHVAARLLVEIAQQLQTNMTQEGKTMQQAWNESLIQMARASQAYAKLLLLTNFWNGIQEEEERSRSSVIGPQEVHVLKDMARLIGLYWLEQNIGDLLEDSFFNPHHVGWIRSAVVQLLDKLRPNAVALVDARDFSDFRLKSVLGRYDGNVYPAILESSKRDPLNQTEPGPGYEEHLKRLYVDGVGVYTGTASRL